MAKKIVQPVEVQASVKGDESIKSFRAQLREAQQDALRLAEAFGETDARTVAAARKVADLKDRMDDVNATIASLHPDKFQAIANITGTMANGFAAAQGAAALLGGESEDLQKAMLRVQGAMAFAQGVSGLKDMKFMLAGIGQQIMSVVVPAFSSLAGAARAFGAALGIGIIITSLTLVIQNFEKIESWLRRIAGLSDWKKLDAQNKARITSMQREIELMEARGETEAKIMMAQANAIVAERKLLREKKSLSEEEKKRHDDLGHELNVLVARATAMRVKTEKEAQTQQTEDMEAAEKERREKAKQRQEQAAADRKAARDKELADFKTYEAQRKAELDARWAAEAEAYKERKAEEAAAEKALLDEQAATYKAFEDGRAKVVEERLKRQQQAEQAAFEHRRTIEAATSQSLGALASLFEQGSAAQKAFALAQIAADSGAAIGAALRNSQSPTDPANPVTGGLAGIAKFAAIAAVIITNSARAVQIVKGGNRGGGIQAPTAAGGGIQRPVLPASSTLGGGNQMAGQWSNKIYVTEGDITGTQRRVNMLRGASVI
jgi:chromosome segregation ATPase